jgi:soluble lytic murein transglycosylase-like protein
MVEGVAGWRLRTRTAWLMRRMGITPVMRDRIRGTALGLVATLALALPASAGNGYDIRLPIEAAPDLIQPVTFVTPYTSVPLPNPPARKPAPAAKPEGVSLRPSPAQPTERRARAVPITMTNFDQGIAAYRNRDLRTALRHFVKTADNKRATHFERAAGAFWAARMADGLNRPAEARELRAIAASYDRSFYGQIARANLGARAQFQWNLPKADLASMNRLANLPEGRAAADHVAAGRLTAADQALLKLLPVADAPLRLAMVNFANHHGLPATALRLAHKVEADQGADVQAAYYPVGAWLDHHEFRVDRALVHAIIRQESGFNPEARSHMGAVGLMQLLPSTANYVIKVKAGGARDRDLTRSVDNLNLGQHYLEYLLAHPGVDGDMIKLLVAYNAGPGNLAKWQRASGDLADRDPLLFIETIPAAETRAYVEKVLAAYWIYRDRFGQDNPGLAELAMAGLVK